MNVNGIPTRTIQLVSIGNREGIEIIDQRKLPHRYERAVLTTTEEVTVAIRDMYVRGAPLIGATAALGMYLAVCEANTKISETNYSSDQREKTFQEFVEEKAILIRSARPTAMNLMWAVDQQLETIFSVSNFSEREILARENGLKIIEDDVEQCRQIGIHGLKLIEELSARKSGETVNILTHCNAGWLATVDWGTATSPMYHAFDQGIDIHIWVDETRPRNQGAKLTAWELGQHGIKHTVIADNTGGHLMQQGLVDIVITGTDRTTRTGDVANKIGTYLKALAAKDNNVPFYVALPSTTFDWNISDGIAGIPIEERGQHEITYMDGLIDGNIGEVLITPPSSPACNYAFDVTPARLVTGLITERGICQANERSILELFPEEH